MPPLLFRSRFIQLPLERLGAIPITAQTWRRLTERNQLWIGHLTQAFAQLLQLLSVGFKRDGYRSRQRKRLHYIRAGGWSAYSARLCVKDSVLQVADGMPLSLVFG
jgi:hypothetical protein